MNAPVSIADAIASLLVANRNPTMREYRAASPCDQRAIERRWVELANKSNEEGDQAWYNWHLAVIGCRHEDDPRGPNEIQRDYDCTIDSRQNYEHGE